KFCEMVKPRFLSYDYYQWWWGAASHFRWLEVHREVAQRYGLPMLVWVEANADPRWEWGKPGATYLPDNLPKIRQSVYTSLAYGAKGIQWFVWTLIFERSPQDRNKPGPALTEAGRDVAKINRELRVLGPVLVRLQSTAVYHTEPVPPGTRPFPQDAPVAVSGRHITAGFFEGADKSTFVMIVNRHIGSRAWPKLVFHRSVKAVEMLDRQSGRWRLLQTHAEPDGRPSLRVVLDKGDGVLLRLRGKPAQL
ncbi:MAG: hypothetical protein H5T86_14735, partial [Armatimonadetes bacterium]|nr:hypothetical protein [Armatimonadota bacterium]